MWYDRMAVHSLKVNSYLKDGMMCKGMIFCSWTYFNAWNTQPENRLMTTHRIAVSIHMEQDCWK